MTELIIWAIGSVAGCFIVAVVFACLKISDNRKD